MNKKLLAIALVSLFGLIHADGDNKIADSGDNKGVSLAWAKDAVVRQANKYPEVTFWSMWAGVNIPTLVAFRRCKAPGIGLLVLMLNGGLFTLLDANDATTPTNFARYIKKLSDDK